MAKILKIEKDQIRSIFDIESKKIYYSVVDSVGIAGKSADPRNYWKVLKNRLKKTQNQLVTNCNQLKMRSVDGKFYLTDAAEADTIIKIIELISPDDVGAFGRYFDHNNLELSKIPLTPTLPEVLNQNIVFKKDESYPQLNLETLKNQEESNNEFSLLVDAYISNNFIIVKAFIAGVDIKNVSITATKNSITIYGNRYIDKQENYLISELAWGKFSRTLNLPQEVREKEMEIREEDGLLIIKLHLLNKNPNKKIVRMRTI